MVQAMVDEELSQRIEQFRKMALDDPDNELGHFSLGKALLEANRFEEAVQSLSRVIAIRSDFSKAYQLKAAALLRLGDRDGGVEALREGVLVAHKRGDLMPRDEMMNTLRNMGAEVPQLTQNSQVEALGEDQVLCKRCGKPGRKLSKPPFKSQFGQDIYAGTCSSCWREAIGMGTKVINELRLPMSDPQAQKIWDQHIREFLNL
jgi:Fe-S cluster biosynthesis and repair protein YggX